MKKLLVLVAILLLAGTASAYVSSHVRSGEVGGEGGRDMFYCQTPFAYSAANAQLIFSAELADDIPDEYVGMSFNQVGTYVLQWGGGEHPPVGVYFNIYDAECPPAQDPIHSYYYTWDQLYTEDVSGNYWCFYAEALLPDVITIVPAMSIGFVIDMGGTEDAPWAGIAQYDQIMGCGEFYWDAVNWGYERWIPFSTYSGYQEDLAYCIGNSTTAVEGSDWTQIKSLY